MYARLFSPKQAAMLGSMSLNVSTELEARIVAKAQELGLPVDDFLDLVLSENEEFAASVKQAESALTPLFREEIEEKIAGVWPNLKLATLSTASASWPA
jgi:hypothetical protein